MDYVRYYLGTSFMVAVPAFRCLPLHGGHRDPLRRLAHLRGHHSKLGLDLDSDTARRGETIYGFVVRAAIGGTREAFETEKVRLAATPEERELAAAANRAAGWPEWQTGDEGPTRSWSAH
jgi:hypothetical protein